ncbi:hypothetical protein FB45DRAFT_862495 [Roridomyces roridus]|uniref:Mid2 domain-containing protein n=1 Tax=Roridomyces roridus TaxID=1738132 RepID=A0AAD7C7I2_9AGAR|nr:hypothetical protein FB45DRAFT_862495 [Roridomyces roridus]
MAVRWAVLFSFFWASVLASTPVNTTITAFDSSVNYKNATVFFNCPDSGSTSTSQCTATLEGQFQISFQGFTILLFLVPTGQCSFLIDGEPTEVVESTDGNSLTFSITNLADAAHTLDVTPGGNPATFLKAIVTICSIRRSGADPVASVDSTTAPASTFRSILFTPNSTPVSKTSQSLFPESTTASLADGAETSVPSSTPTRQSAGKIAAAAVIGTLLFLCTMSGVVVFFRRRRKKAQVARLDPYPAEQAEPGREKTRSRSDGTNAGI